MNTDGSNRQRLTFFNERGYPEYIRGRTVVSDSAWSPDGKTLIVTVAYGSLFSKGSKIFLLELE